MKSEKSETNVLENYSNFFRFCFAFRSSIIEKFEKAREKHEYYKNPIPPDTSMATLQKRWRSSTTIQAIQSEPNPDSIEDDAKKLASSNTN